MKHDNVVAAGSGFAGLFPMRRLREPGFGVQVLEAAGDVGGIWYLNRHPGARCDVESLGYSFSFDKALQQEWTSSERYSAQPEILSYVRYFADRFDLRATSISTAASPMPSSTRAATAGP